MKKKQQQNVGWETQRLVLRKQYSKLCLNKCSLIKKNKQKNRLLLHTLLVIILYHLFNLYYYTFRWTAVYYDANHKSHYVVKSSHQSSNRIIINPSSRTIKGPTKQNIFIVSRCSFTLPFSKVDLSQHLLSLLIASLTFFICPVNNPWYFNCNCVIQTINYIQLLNKPTVYPDKVKFLIKTADENVSIK